MDVFEYRTSRSLNTEGMFTNTNPNTEIGGLFIRLKNLMVSELHLQWDTAFLEQYAKEKMVPRGLRWDIHPQQDEPDLESWFKYFNEEGLKLLGFLIDKKQTKLSLIDSEIRELRDKLTPHKTSAEYILLSTNLRNTLEKEEKDQRDKKSTIETLQITPHFRSLTGRRSSTLLLLPMGNLQLWRSPQQPQLIQTEHWSTNHYTNQNLRCPHLSKESQNKDPPTLLRPPSAPEPDRERCYRGKRLVQRTSYRLLL